MRLIAKTLKLVATCTALAATSLLPVWGQAFPDKPVRLVVPYAPGGVNDILGRIVAKELSVIWGQPVIVDNKPGANGVIGLQFVAKAPADGYTLLLGTPGPLTQNAALQTLPFDVLKDFTPIAQMVDIPSALVIDPKLPANTLPEFLQLARDAKAPMSYSTPGIGNGSHFYMEMLKQQANVNLTHIPYKGAAPALADVMAGLVQTCITSVAAVLPHAPTGRLKVLAVTSAERMPQLPNVPTVKELGFPGLEVSVYGGVLGPANMPKALVQKIYTDAMKAMKAPEFLAALKSNALVPVSATPDQFAALMVTDLARWKKVAREANIKPE